MQFTTPIPISKYSNSIDYSSKLFCVGSCFAENMGEKLEYFKFQNMVNPFGIIFNPISIENLIRRSVEKKYFTESDIFFHNDLWHCYEVHSKLSNPNKTKFLDELNRIVESTHLHIGKLTHCIVTLGTAWVYILRQAQNDMRSVVANCHKIPQKQFTKHLLSAEEIERSLQNIISLVLQINPNCKFIFTVSPVRHIKDGFFENNISKAHLLSAVYKLSTEHCQLNTEYFQSYEIMIDELRDYRFYAEDMLHPNQIAIDYIWQKFIENYVDENQFQTMEEVCNIQKGLAHRPFNSQTEAHQKFLQSLNHRIVSIQQQFPHITF